MIKSLKNIHVKTANIQKKDFVSKQYNPSKPAKYVNINIDWWHTHGRMTRDTLLFLSDNIECLYLIIQGICIQLPLLQYAHQQSTSTITHIRVKVIDMRRARDMTLKSQGKSSIVCETKVQRKWAKWARNSCLVGLASITNIGFIFKPTHCLYTLF